MEPGAKARGVHRPPRYVFFLLLMDMVSLGVVLPILPAAVAELAGPGGAVHFWYGAATFTFAVSFFASAAMAGKISDRLGRRPLMLASCAGLAAGNFVCAAAPGVALLIAGRTLCGLCSANIVLSQAYVADLWPPKERGRALGLLGAMQGLGFIIGPMIGGYLGRTDLQHAFVAAGFSTALGGLGAVFLLRESLPPERRRATVGRLNPFSALQGLRRVPGFGALVPAFAVVMLAGSIAIISWVPYATARFGWDTAQNGWALCFFGLCGMISQGLFFPLAVKKFPIPLICLGGLCSVVAAYTAFALTSHGWVSFVIIAGNLVGLSVLVSFQTMASMRADEKSQGATLGGLQALNNLMLVVAPVFAAVLLSVMSSAGATSWWAGLPFFFCAALVFLAIVLAGPRLAKLGAEESAGLMCREREHGPQAPTSL